MNLLQGCNPQTWDGLPVGAFLHSIETAMNRGMMKIANIVILVALALVSNGVESALNHSAPALAVNCSSILRHLAKYCWSFVSRGSTTKKPESSCCSGLKTALNFDPDCLCEGFNQLDLTTTDLYKVLSLPVACNVSNSNCKLSVGTVGNTPGDTKSYYVNTENHQTRNGLKIGLSIAATVIVILLVIGCYCYCKLKNPSNKSKDNQNLDGLIKEYGFLAPKRYSYSEIKKMTNSLRDKLGEGGFGEVYKGTLIDGRPVAVKILKATKSDGEDFVN